MEALKVPCISHALTSFDYIAIHIHKYFQNHISNIIKLV
jgi:hypothetical protein